MILGRVWVVRVNGSPDEHAIDVHAVGVVTGHV